ncbi:hypothetical protein MRX96_050380 [Rhipicephalus microplus]
MTQDLISASEEALTAPPKRTQLLRRPHSGRRHRRRHPGGARSFGRPHQANGSPYAADLRQLQGLDETASAFRPVFFGRQRLPQKPPPLKPVFLTAPQRPLEDWKACVGNVAVATPNLGWVGKLCLPFEAPGFVTDDDMSIEDTE